MKLPGQRCIEMNIIFYRYSSVCEPDFIDAFKSLGINVVEDRDGSQIQGNVDLKMRHLGDMIAEHKPMFVFSINFFPFISILCNRLKVKYVAESVDCPVFELYDNAIMGEYNRIFLFDYKQYESLNKYNPSGVFYLPLGAPAKRTTKLLEKEEDFLFDISFVGSLYKEKDPYLRTSLSGTKKKRLGGLINEQMIKSSGGLDYIEENLTDSDIADIKASDTGFYSTDRSLMNLDRFVAINDYISPHIAYLERISLLNEIAEKTGREIHLFTKSETSDLNKKIHFHGGVSTLVEMPCVFRQSKINLNMTMRSIQTGLPQRIWDVLACRGFLITNDQLEVSEYFKVGYHLETYRDKKELIDKINYYMIHEDERCRIAQRGYEEVAARHTVLQRVVSIVKVILGL